MTRRDELTGAQTVINESRQNRPNLPDDSCPFCPGGRESPDEYDVRHFVNRWPALPDERCEVVLYSPLHGASLASLGIAGTRRVVDVWAERTAVLSSRVDVSYVLIFENRGPEVGATIYHPHGQIYAFDEVPPVPLQELNDGHLDPNAVEPSVRVSASGEWISWVPQAATYPYELRMAQLSPARSLDDPRCDLDGFAETLADSLARLDQIFDEEMPYMMWIHQLPLDSSDWPHSRIHVHVIPTLRAPGVQRFVAAAELGAGIFFNPVSPARAAASLRELPGVG